MTHTEIDAILNDAELQSTELFPRLFQKYYEELSEPKPVIDDDYVLPTFTQAEYDAEFAIYIQELHDIETERERKQDLRDRFAALEDMRVAFHSIRTESNPAKWLEDLMSQDHAQAEADMAALEAEDVSQKTARDAVQYKEDRAKAYDPIGDQLDCIVKALKFLKDNGTDIGADGDALVASSEAVKAAHPKP